MGVTSRIMVTLMPAAWIARIADSRPAPGPFTYTATWRTPCSVALRAQLSAATCAAYGVDLREPLAPVLPEVDQRSAAPPGSVRVMIALLTVDWMWAMPDWTFFLTFFLPPLATFVPYFFTVACFFPATVFLGPLRVRALVWVRWPRMGRPRRW